MLTPFGTALLPYINDMLDRNEQLNNFIADYKHEKRGRVTIYAPTGIITYLSKHVIDKIKDIGDITLSLKTCNLERNAFYEGVEFPDDCDVLISYAPPKDESLVASFITQYAVTAYASQRYLEKHPISRPDELEHHSCILIDSMMIDDANIWRFNVAGSKEVRDYRVKGNYVCDNTQSALELARNHLGIVFAPDKSVQSDLQDGTLVPCFQQPYEWWLDLVAIFRKREYQPWRGSDGVIATIELDEHTDLSALPDGIYAQVAVYSDHFSHVSVMRKVLLRMTSWVHYLYLDH